MVDKLLTVQELANYLNMSEEKIVELVEKRIIVAYKIGGELLRFRKEQIDAIRSEIYDFVNNKNNETQNKKKGSKLKYQEKKIKDTFLDKLIDFFYFSDFYIICGFIICILFFFVIF